MTSPPGSPSSYLDRNFFLQSPFKHDQAFTSPLHGNSPISMDIGVGLGLVEEPQWEAATPSLPQRLAARTGPASAGKTSSVPTTSNNGLHSVVMHTTLSTPLLVNSVQRPERITWVTGSTHTPASLVGLSGEGRYIRHLALLPGQNPLWTSFGRVLLSVFRNSDRRSEIQKSFVWAFNASYHLEILLEDHGIRDLLENLCVFLWILAIIGKRSKLCSVQMIVGYFRSSLALWFSLLFSRRCLTFAPKTYSAVFTTMRWILRRRTIWSALRLVSSKLCLSKSYYLERRETKRNLVERFPSWKRDLKTTFKIGNPGTVLSLPEY